ncbi:hypothetical protein [Adhaeretor mobilis]|uniref:VWFA domain-containing protein n=1 Tax=Adhaeretor mobilis TaxID=1930276 RepID=A0A517MX27_9BACT|nr:hypothetical protein [Adhaeretor mobilis]QDS99430.1 hypothetical protein HG15A2_27530 [Adhaeretor mobilis]
MISTTSYQLIAATSDLTTYQLERLVEADDPRSFLALLVIGLVLGLLFVIWQYGRESSSLPRSVAVLLGFLRIVAIAGAVVFFLKPTKRTDQMIIEDSQVTVLVDVSQSMAVEDETYGDGKGLTRSEAVADLLTDSQLLKGLSDQHDVSVRVFGGLTRRIAQWKRGEFTAEKQSDGDARSKEEAPDFTEQPSSSLDWKTELKPLGPTTNLGDVLADALEDASRKPLVGVVVISDGVNNSGVAPADLTEMAQANEVPIYTVGLGSTRPRTNLRLQELAAPPRAYPDDKTKVRAIVHAEGFRNRSFTVELFAKQGEGSPATLVGKQTLDILSDAQTESLEFEIQPTEVGRIELEARINAPTDDQYAGDNSKRAEIDVIETATRVLLVASGATREYRFLRNQLQRDRHTTVDVLLQLSTLGISQDADEVLTDFPSEKADLFEYDCIVAFDPDWTLLDAQQVQLLENWVSEQAGALILIAGPIHTAAWVQSPEHAPIRGLYPIEFQRRLTLLDDGIYGSTTPWPIEFSRAGEEAGFLSLADSSEESRALWAEFPGVYGCYAVKGAKPGAQVYGRYSDPDAGISVERPVYMAEQFYGSGRVFYLGSGEMWRLRAVDPGLLERFYTQLIRHTTQGRLHRGSSRGMLLIARDEYTVGEEVPLRAQLRTASQEPYLAKQVALRVTDPQGKSQTMGLMADENRPGNFLGQLSVNLQGDYRLELPAPDSVDELITRRLGVSLPDLEFEQTRRNVDLLAKLAESTGGRYYSSLRVAAEGVDDLRPLGDAIESRAETKIMRGKVSKKYSERIHLTLLGVIAGALSLEWLLRRLMKLA